MRNYGLLTLCGLLAQAAAILVLSFCIVVPAPSRVFAQTPIPDKEAVINYFSEETFVQVPNQPEKIAVKWARPIRVKIFNKDGVSPAVVALAAERILDIQKATQHDIQFVENDIYFVVFFTHDMEKDLKAFRRSLMNVFPTDAEFDAFLAEARHAGWTCGSQTAHTGNSGDGFSILAHFRIISVAGNLSSNRIETCLEEGLAAGMGLTLGHAPSPGDFRAVGTRFLQVDLPMMAVLYRPEIKSGQSEKQVLLSLDEIYRKK